jgi:lysophospholipase L1-like esterase
VVLGGWEAFCRAFPALEQRQPRLHYIEPDPDLLWRLKPLEEGPQATNELGLRDTTYRPDADVKLLLLGDSVSYGDGEPVLTRCFPWLLERELEAATPGRTWELINAGVIGWSTFQEARWLELHGLALRPRAVVLQFCLNDVFERYTSVAAYGGQATFFGIDTREGTRGLHGWLVRASRGYERLALAWQRRARRRAAYQAELLCQPELPPELESAWTETEADLERLLGVCRANGLPLLVVIAPYAFQLDDPAGLDRPQRRLEAWCRRQGVAFCDLLPALAAAPRQPPLFFDANHFAPAGQAVVAGALREPVRRLAGE